MARKPECIAMLLAGGQGSRLGILTKNIAKPAVPYGGKYRIIDFPLSNCINSGIDTVGVLTQYQPLELNDYIGNGQPWDLDRENGGVHILSPYQQIKGTEWYKGTANAIYQNINFIERYDPEYVLILSGDHIYKMDYAKMLDYHKEKDAACTIAMLEVPWDEASRFGLMIVNEDGSISEFEEKPKNPRSNKASMGVYIFNWQKLRKYLIEDEAKEDSGNDFGHDVIPAMHSNGERMFAYQFDGYWKDVGTINSLWDANLDLLNPKVDLDLDDDSWRIYSKSPAAPPHFTGSSAKIENSMINEGCEINGNIDFSELDEVVRLCGKYGLYLIIDLHGLQGYQNDYDHCGRSKHMSLFDDDETSARYRDVVTDFWVEIAKHYAGNPTIAMYDLMNEPLGTNITVDKSQRQAFWDFSDRL